MTSPAARAASIRLALLVCLALLGPASAFAVDQPAVTATDLLDPQMFRDPQFGMKVESAKDGDVAEVKTTGAVFRIDKKAGTVTCRQTIAADRDVAVIRFPGRSLAGLRLREHTAGLAYFEGGGTRLRINGDSLLMVAPGEDGAIEASLQFMPDFHSAYRGNHNFFDPRGGISFYEHAQVGSSKVAREGDTVQVAWDWKRGQVFWAGISPPKPFDWEAARTMRVVVTGGSNPRYMFPPDLMVGPGGLLISHVHFDTRKPLQAGVDDEHPCFRQVLDSVWGPQTPRPSPSDWHYGENTLWATGWLLWSQLVRHRVTGEDEALALARKCFHDISHVFEMSRELDPGILGKPHGGRPGETISFDQSANPILFYLRFAQRHGTDAEVEQARRNLHDYARLIIGRDWTVNQHGHVKRIVQPAHTSSSKVVAAVHAGSVLSGDAAVRDEAGRQLQGIIDEGLFPWPQPVYEINTNVMYYALLGEYWHGTEMADAADWLGMIGAYWRAAQTALDPDGVVLAGTYDTRTGAFSPVREHWSDLPPTTAGTQPSQRWWHSPTSYGGRTLFTASAAIVGMMARRHGHDDEAHLRVRRTLTSLGPDTMRQFWLDNTTPEYYRPTANLFAPELPALWLVAYWMGREQEAW